MKSAFPTSVHYHIWVIRVLRLSVCVFSVCSLLPCAARTLFLALSLWLSFMSISPCVSLPYYKFFQVGNFVDLTVIVN